jgi:xanthine dehydrogenase accessory factor
MYEIALSVSACLRSNTQADIAWVISPTALSSTQMAVAITPGGGKIGTLLGDAFNPKLAELSPSQLSSGRKLEIRVGPAESLVSQLPIDTELEIIFAPAKDFPSALWQLLIDREPLALVCEFENKYLKRTEVFSQQDLNSADESIKALFNQSEPSVLVTDNKVITFFTPITKLVIAGTGPIADALAKTAESLGWQVVIDMRTDIVAGYMATLSKKDCAVIMGHDVEASSRNLMAAIKSKVGYIGALGSKKMQLNRADWLAYRDITDLSRVHGPAGLAIGAETPQEIAVSILAEAIKVQKNL